MHLARFAGSKLRNCTRAKNQAPLFANLRTRIIVNSFSRQELLLHGRHECKMTSVEFKVHGSLLNLYSSSVGINLRNALALFTISAKSNSWYVGASVKHCLQKCVLRIAHTSGAILSAIDAPSIDIMTFTTKKTDTMQNKERDMFGKRFRYSLSNGSQYDSPIRAIDDNAQCLFVLGIAG